MRKIEKNPAAHVRKWATKALATTGKSHQQAEVRGMAQRDRLLTRIQAFDEADGGGVLIRKDSKGYSLFREDTGEPVARLRPTGTGDHVQIMWWSWRDKWEQIGDFGPMVMPLEEALKYVAEDPMGIFWR